MVALRPPVEVNRPASSDSQMVTRMVSPTPSTGAPGLELPKASVNLGSWKRLVTWTTVSSIGNSSNVSSLAVLVTATLLGPSEGSTWAQPPSANATATARAPDHGRPVADRSRFAAIIHPCLNKAAIPDCSPPQQRLEGECVPSARDINIPNPLRSEVQSHTKDL